MSNESGQTWTDIILSDRCLKTEFLGVCQWQVKSRPLTIFPAPRLSAKASFFGHYFNVDNFCSNNIPLSLICVYCVYHDILLLTCSPDTFSPLLIFYSTVFAIVGDTFGKFICIRIFLKRTNSAGRKQSNCSNHRHLAANQTGCLALGLNLRHLASIRRRKRFLLVSCPPSSEKQLVWLPLEVGTTYLIQPPCASMSPKRQSMGTEAWCRF